MSNISRVNVETNLTCMLRDHDKTNVYEVLVFIYFTSIIAKIRHGKNLQIIMRNESQGVLKCGNKSYFSVSISGCFSDVFLVDQSS